LTPRIQKREEGSRGKEKGKNNKKGRRRKERGGMALCKGKNPQLKKKKKNSAGTRGGKKRIKILGDRNN